MNVTASLDDFFHNYNLHNIKNAQNLAAAQNPVSSHWQNTL